MVAITNACSEWIVFGEVELDKDNAATIDVMRRALLPSNACVPALPVRGVVPRFRYLNVPRRHFH